ncbi:MAG: hypothetical protein QF613_08310 [Candidatus Marinimicrobia bacterium]|jgi:hypothetical protein|nr:hypothetical protein [Candidatus Neomarinimicrobiota bacterium]MDP6594187.1 hypothetical protein [Candidatus Neomarinimicrobiota bacterium]MDP6837040.1 hypothetical protein [Candidatus Neomarinimicrobiota bacterium]MDP6966177.1 hypothetical protein [Candidatus Neomarinimicrobiota bacterium]|tara:strand:- start:104 stop:397 length:294 start_codon:yes stop_codon:yes gene_type:complete
MKLKSVKTLNREELHEYLLEIQDYVDDILKSGKNIDTLLYETDLFDEFEQILPDEEFGIFIIILLNRIRIDSIIDRLLNVIEYSQDSDNGRIVKSRG